MNFYLDENRKDFKKDMLEFIIENREGKHYQIAMAIAEGLIYERKINEIRATRKSKRNKINVINKNEVPLM